MGSRQGSKEHENGRRGHKDGLQTRILAPFLADTALLGVGNDVGKKPSITYATRRHALRLFCCWCCFGFVCFIFPFFFQKFRAGGREHRFSLSPNFLLSPSPTPSPDSMLCLEKWSVLSLWHSWCFFPKEPQLLPSLLKIIYFLSIS